jgi:hypothetical protein
MAERKPTVELEIRPDGTVHFTISGAPGRACEELESVILQALRGEVIDREHTSEFFSGEVLPERERARQKQR